MYMPGYSTSESDFGKGVVRIETTYVSSTPQSL